MGPDGADDTGGDGDSVDTGGLSRLGELGVVDGGAPTGASISRPAPVVTGGKALTGIGPDGATGTGFAGDTGPAFSAGGAAAGGGTRTSAT
ncbi:hypothetical protein [Amycolatopsis sp. NPDC059020]|uniref:hypothetical protein n=1 Tax=Amycolatopsis sp. NPDC059020 TaxID=3346703 RepID=UPI00366CD9DA